MQMVAIGGFHDNFIPNRNLLNTSEIMSIPVVMGDNRIERQGDKCRIKHIAFTMDNIDELQFKNLVKDYVIQIVIGGSPVFEFKMDFLLELNPVLRIDNTFSVNLSLDYFFNEIYLICLQYHETVFRIIGNNNNFAIELFLEYIFLNNEQRRQLASNEQSAVIQQILKVGQYEDTNSTTSIRLNSKGCTKGFFIKGNIDEITNMKFIINGRERFTFTKTMINLYTTKISNNMFYVSLSGNTNYQILSEESYINSINMSRIDIATMDFQFLNNNSQKKIEIYSVTMNILKYVLGMINIVFYFELFMNYRSPAQNFSIIPVPSSVITYTTIIRGIEPDNNTCAITFEEIVDFYCKCSTCNNNFSFNAINQWFITKKNCPLCRSAWSNFNKYCVSQDVLNNTLAQNNTIVQNNLNNINNDLYFGGDDLLDGEENDTVLLNGEENNTILLNGEENDTVLLNGEGVLVNNFVQNSLDNNTVLHLQDF